MEKQELKIHNILKALFIINLVLFLIVEVVLMFAKGPIWNEFETNVIFERYAIIVTLAAIPSVLKLYQSRLEKYKSLNIEHFGKKYITLYILRLLILDAVVVMNLIGFYLYESENFIIMALITTVAFLFCLPNKDTFPKPKKIEDDVDEEPEN